jgi:hypothetical protein
MSRARRWCFTLNNWTEEEYEKVKEIKCEYMIVGKEVGESGTPHLQGYVVFKGQKRQETLKREIPRAHLEVAKGSPTQNYEYCTKEDEEPFEFGERPADTGKKGGEANKRRFEEAFTAAKEGRLDDIDADILTRYYRTYKQIKTDYAQMPEDAEDVTGTWLWGEPGVGKSRRAREENPGAYLKNCNKWWDGYQDQPAVIIDDFDKTHNKLDPPRS